MKIKEVKAWGVEPRNGKHAYTVVFEEEPGTPVDFFSANEPKVGDKVDGKIGTSDKGRPTYYEPYRLDRHQANIMSQWATRLGFEFASDHTNKEEIKALADMALDIALETAEERSE